MTPPMTHRPNTAPTNRQGDGQAPRRAVDELQRSDDEEGQQERRPDGRGDAGTEHAQSLTDNITHRPASLSFCEA
ncbi:hypothetical protein [Parascardovia denticolens]|uniref:hypothetical protein n=1 Tax=Parascardovia denticolens TaxID=78258 RepID=UPI00117FFE74|nr:hypothetical protein [Parascardovia denticolens]